MNPRPLSYVGRIFRCGFLYLHLQARHVAGSEDPAYVRIVLASAAIAMCLAGAVLAQGRLFDGMRFEPRVTKVTYDGRFVFARLRYTPKPDGWYYGGLPAWAHGYLSLKGGGRAEFGLVKILNEISYLNAHLDETAVVALDDPELGKYPVSYMAEAGWWTLTDKEAAAFRAYFQKGGFVIFDDFRDPPVGGGGWANFEANMRRVLPDGRFIDLDPSSPIFHSFFEINSFDLIPQSYDEGRPVLRGLFENNDPTKRLMAIANFNTDVSDFWEFLGTGFKPIDESNEAYKLGVNYIFYGMTH
jgi:hypothetical protein